MERRNTFADREAPVRLLKSEKDIAENSKAVRNLPRRTSGILQNSDHLEKSRSISLVHLCSEWQLVNDNCNSETRSIKELYVSPDLQFSQTSGITDHADNREMSEDLKSDCTGSFSPYQPVCQTSEVNNRNYRNKPSFQNEVSRSSNSDQTGEQNFCPRQSASKNSLIPCASALGKPVTHKAQIMALKDEQDYLQVRFSDLTTFQEDREGKKCLTELLQVRTLENGLKSGQSEHAGQVDPVENLIEQLRRELALLRSQVRHIYSMCMLISIAVIQKVNSNNTDVLVYFHLY